MMLTKLLYHFLIFKTKSVNYKNKKFTIMLADSFAKQMLGLMHRPTILSDEGMLFIFGHESKQGIWMLNMKFAIDCIWISEDGKVVDLVKNMKPCSSMFNCPAYPPENPAKYVLELKSGMVAKLKISKGSDLSIFIR